MSYSPDDTPVCGTARVDEIMRLANLFAAARVRKYAKAIGHAPLESKWGVERKVKAAREALRDYVERTVI